MQSLIETAKAVPEFAKAVYSDGVAGTLQQIGKIGEDAARTLRLVLFPLQFTAALQDRLAAYIDESLRKIPEHRRIAPPQSLALELCERLRRCDPGEVVARMYVDLLARAMDKERVGEAHPAFVQVISQLAPDEVALIQQLGVHLPLEAGLDHVYVRDEVSKGVLQRKDALRLLQAKQVPNDFRSHVIDRLIAPEHLAQPELAGTFLQHVQSLGLLEYVNAEWSNDGFRALKPEGILLTIRLSLFGQLFYTACVPR